LDFYVELLKMGNSLIFNLQAFLPEEEYERSFADIHEKAYNGVGGYHLGGRQYARGKRADRAYRGADHRLCDGPGIFGEYVLAAMESRARCCEQCEKADALGAGFAFAGIIYSTLRSRPDFYAGVLHSSVGVCPMLCLGDGSHDPHE
jgi:hypothetical protein